MAKKSRPRILLVNDDVYQLSLIENLLEKEGWDVTSISQTEKAIEKIRKEPPFDIVITDLHMPVIDGWRFCRLLRSQEFLEYNDTPLLVISATFSGADAEGITKDIGANAFLPIPFKPENLRKVVGKLLQGKCHCVKPKVLIVEDSRSQRYPICKSFKKAGFQVFEASTGEEATSIFQATNPDIVILDYQLPDITGDKLISIFKEPPSLTAVILITVNPSSELAVEILRLGADAYVRKPFKTEYLIDLTKKIQRERALLRIEDLLEKRTKELQKSRENFQTVADFTFNWEFWLNPDGSFVYSSPSCERLTGYPKEDFLKGAVQFNDLAHPEDQKIMESFYRNALGGGSGQELPCKIRDSEGEVHWVSITWRPIVKENGDFQGTRGCMQDITSKYKVEKQQKILRNLAFALNATNSIDKALQFCLRAAIQGVEFDLGAIFTVDEQKGEMKFNCCFGCALHRKYDQKIFHLNSEINNLFKNAIPIHLAPINLGSPLDQYFEEEGIHIDIFLPVKVEGKVLAFLLLGSKKTRLIGKLEIRFLEILGDQIARTISRAQLQEALRQSEAKFRSLFESAGDAILILKGEVIVDCNHKATDMFGCGRSDILGKSLDCFSPTTQPNGQSSSTLILEKIEAAIENGAQFYYWQHKKLTSETFETEISLNRFDLGHDIYLQAIIRDITERKRLEKQLQHAQKMEAVGTLAGGIAHDFNNILGGIMGYIDLLKMEAKSDDRTYQILNRVENAGQRAIELTKQMLTFSRRNQIEIRCFDINESIDNVANLLRRTLDKRIEVILDLNDQIPGILGDSGQIEQMIMNLSVNAADAMDDGGKLIIRTGLVDIDQTNFGNEVDLEEGTYVCLEISDTGCGMDEGTKRRIFEPFFTTKDVGKGTGLGLAMVYGIIKNHKGNIQVESELGKGTTFTILLPAGEKIEKQERIPCEMPVRGSGTILVVDDEEIIRNMLSEILEKLGYKILLAEDGRHGVEVFKKYQDKIDIVVLDMNMPVMGGRETFRKMKAINPDVRALLATGFAMNQSSQDLLDEGFLGYITKPFTINQLSYKIREITCTTNVKKATEQSVTLLPV